MFINGPRNLEISELMELLIRVIILVSNFLLFKTCFLHRGEISNYYIFLKIKNSWRQKIAILIRMQILNDIIKSRHGFKTAQKFHKFRFLIKTLNL